MSWNFLQAFWRLTFGVLYKHWLASVLMEQDFADPWVVLEPHCCTAQETENNMCTWLARVVSKTAEQFENGTNLTYGGVQTSWSHLEKGVRFACTHVANSKDQTTQLILIIALS